MALDPEIYRKHKCEPMGIKLSKSRPKVPGWMGRSYGAVGESGWESRCDQNACMRSQRITRVFLRNMCLKKNDLLWSLLPLKILNTKTISFMFVNPEFLS